MCSSHFADRPDRATLEHGTVFAPKFDETGVIPCIATDASSGEVLMFAWMNEESLALTIETGVAHYWSRSRGKLWLKGEESGNTQRVVEMRTDCDQDVLWIRVEPQGIGAACHNGYKSCFYRTVPTGRHPSPALALDFTADKPMFDPKAVYGKK
jgi:phosphoribosyl-AMP cyclohydrolase